jgi:hypothetical protein
MLEICLTEQNSENLLSYVNYDKRQRQQASLTEMQFIKTDAQCAL